MISERDGGRKKVSGERIIQRLVPKKVMVERVGNIALRKFPGNELELIASGTDRIISIFQY